MRLRDVRDWWLLRRLTRNAGQIVRFRKGYQQGERLSVEFRDRPSLHLRGGSSDYHMFHRIFLEDEYRLQGLAPWECVVDLGGNVGVFTARVAPECKRVFTYEPEPDNYSRLQENTSGFPQVTVVNAAVSDQDGELRLFAPKNRELRGVFSIYQDGDLVSDDYCTVPAWSLQSVFDQHGIERCDLLKIDVEGAEYPILGGASPETLARIQRIHGEYHDVNPEDPLTRIANFQRFLEERGFAVELLEHRRKPNHGMFFAHRARA